MKKEFKRLLDASNANLRISNIAKLYRYTRDGLGNDCDRLQIIFNSPTGCVSFYTADIEARTTEGIAREIGEHTKAFAEKWAAEESRKMLAGNMSFVFEDFSEKLDD